MTFEAVTFGTFGEPNVCSTQVAEGEVPSSDENVLAVSGSSAIENADGSLVAQSAFPQSGGGVSLLFPVKAWQRSIPGVNLAGRNTPDIVLTTEVNGAGPSAYTAMIVQDYYYPPAWDGGQDVVDNASAAGLLAGIQEMVGHRLGAFNQTLYELFAKTGYGTAFKDITVGCNGFLNGKAFCAKAGYDLTSGVGTIDAYQVGKLLH
jgi:subtilase family serine protease